MDKRIQKTILIAALLIVSRVALASGDAHAGEHAGGLDEQTIKTIIYQFINVTVLIVALISFLKKPVVTFFKNKKETYLGAAQKAQSARLAAEEEKMHIQVRLNKLESTADESISRAKADAAQMKNQLLTEAEALSKRIREEASLAAKLEVERAKTHLREQMIKESVEMSRAQMSKVTNEDHQRLQGEFITNIQAVQR